MGNAGQCCSADSRCCSGKENKEVGAPVGAAPINSSEVRGFEDSRTPGFTGSMDVGAPGAVQKAKDAGERPGIELASSTKEEVCPGGDSAAGGPGSDGKQEYQYVTYEDGSTYIGQISEGKRHGNGIWQSKTGQYEGQWKADAQHGKGRQTWSDGRVYDGEFQNGRFSGKGRMVWHTQKGMLIYEGNYKEDLKDGEGKFVWADGRTYDGQWSKGKRHGRGMYMNKNCERKIGYWMDDKFDHWESPEEAQAFSTNAP